MTEKYILLQEVGTQGLTTLIHLIDKAKEHVASCGIEESSILSAKLAPDMYDFTKQVQVASDDIRRNILLLAGKEHVPFEDNETTLDALKLRLASTLEIISQVKESDFTLADDRQITLFWMGNKYVEGKDFLKEFTFMNFLFHTVTAYDILRASGVPLGKMDYITKFSMKERA